MHTDADYFDYPQAQGGSKPASETGYPPQGIQQAPANSPHGGVTYFMDISIDPLSLATGELHQRLCPGDFPQIGKGPMFAFPDPVRVGPHDDPTYPSCID